jgi:hypothetical protein
MAAATTAMPAPLPTNLRAEFWTDLDGIPKEGEEYPLSDATAARRVLDEAAFVFSGMLDGFDFEWTPANKGRQVEEAFALTTQGSVEWGDPRLRPGEAKRDPSRMSAWIEFRPDETDLRVFETSRASTWKTSQGDAGVDRMRGFPGRREAYVAAVKAGVEALLRSTEPNRPRSVKGRAVFAAPPVIAIVDGEYRVQARLRIEITELRRWSIF